jgi:hypothetical protein
MVPPTSRPPPRPGIAFSERIRSRDVRGISASIVLSAVLHLAFLVILLLAPALSRPGVRRVYAPEWLVELARPLVGERIILLERPEPRIAGQPPAAAPTPVELPALVAPAPELGPPAPPGAPAPSGLVGAEAPVEEPAAGGGGAPDGARTAAERLRPGEKDPRLWFILPEEIVGLSPEQRMELDLALGIAAMEDSARAVAIASRPFRDWTYTDDQGRRWGIADGTVFLGGFLPPIPFGFAPPPNSFAARRMAEDAAIASQAARQQTRQSLRDRAAEIRRRRDAERARARGDTTRVLVQDR